MNNKAKLMADFLSAHLRFPDILPKGAAIFFVFQLTKWLDRIGVHYAVRQIDLRPVKSKMFIPGWEAEAENVRPATEIALDIDDGLYSNRGNIIDAEEHRRIHDILPISRYELGRRAADSHISREKREEITSYVNALASTYYSWLSKRAKSTHNGTEGSIASDQFAQTHS